MLNEARARGQDVTTEAYPYAAGMTEIQSATIQDRYRGAPAERLAELEWPPTGERLNRESFERYSRIGGPVVVHTQHGTDGRCRDKQSTDHGGQRRLLAETAPAIRGPPAPSPECSAATCARPTHSR